MAQHRKKKRPAYSGQASTVFFESPIINGIADKHHVTPAQVVLSWCVQRGTIVIPKSENEQRLLANITVNINTSCLPDLLTCF